MSSERASDPLKSFVVLSHAVIHDGHDLFGPAHNVVEHLVAAGYPTELVLHPLTGSAETIHRSFRARALVEERRFRVRGRAGELRENRRLVRQLDPTITIAVDPLNQLGAWLASLGRSSAITVYYTADMARRRFSNPVLNAAYHGLDRFSLRAAAVSWSVSDAIAEQRTLQGVAASDNLVVPNAPPIDLQAVSAWEGRDPESLVFVGMLDPIFDWELLLDGLAALVPTRPSLLVHLVGDGPEGERLRREAARRGLASNVRFHGLLAHSDALAMIGRSRLGLALYSGAAPWNVFGDSLKVREYFSRGVPVVSTPSHPLADVLERRGAGAVVSSAEQFAAAVERLLAPTAGAAAAAAALVIASETDRTRVMERALDDLRRRVLAGRGHPEHPA